MIFLTTKITENTEAKINVAENFIYYFYFFSVNSVRSVVKNGLCHFLNKTLFLQHEYDLAGGLVRRHICRVDARLAIFGHLVRIVNAGVTFDQPCPGLGIHAFAVSFFTLFQGCGYMHLDKAPIAFDGLAYFPAGGRIGCNRSANGNAAVFGDLAGNKTDALDVNIPVLF